MVSSNYSYLIVVIYLHTVIWFQVFLSNTNNFQTDLFNSAIGPKEVLLLWFRVDLGVMAMKREVHILQSSRTGASPLEAVLCHTQDNSSKEESYLSAEDTAQWTILSLDLPMKSTNCYFVLGYKSRFLFIFGWYFLTSILSELISLL